MSLVTERAESGSGFEGRHQVLLPARVVETSRRQKPLLHGRLATGAGYSAKAADPGRRRPEGIDEAILIYCVKDRG